jgi:uncharacterized membrane protein (UPF0127 family)
MLVAVVTVGLENQRTGARVATRLREASNPITRMVGLLGKKTLPDGEALLIRPCWSIHTWFMRFSLDVIFLDRENRVVRVIRDMKPWRIAAAKGSHSVIEMKAGLLTEDDLAPGDQLRIA